MLVASRTFDVIVVGAGSAGCVVASRLAENSSRSVLLLEAGPDLRAHPPDGMHDGWGMYREHGWGYESQPDQDGVVTPLHRGKLVGGTSWVTRYAMRGSPADFEEWVGLGNIGWGFDDVLPSFNRLENDLDFGAQPWHGSRGPLPVTRFPGLEPTEYEAALLRAFAANGFQTVDDHNRPGAVGFGRMPRSAYDGSRVTTADAYLPVGGTPQNLEVRADSQVADIVLDGGQAAGVRLLDGTVTAGGWVVLCAGTYGSPTLLMRSGIGPANHLARVDVSVQVDLAGVGSNLADHPSPDIDLGYRGQYRTAPIMDLMATFLGSAAHPAGPPDLGLWVSEPAGEPPEAFVDVLLLKPLSRGRVRLDSPDPHQPPRIELPGLRDEQDVDRTCEGFSRGLEIARSADLQRVCAGPITPDPRDAREVRAAVLQRVSSVPHTVGAPAPYASSRRTAPWSTRSAACTVSAGSVLSTHRSSLRHPQVFPR